jgi:hypothetical protein
MNTDFITSHSQKDTSHNREVINLSALYSIIACLDQDPDTAYPMAVDHDNLTCTVWQLSVVKASLICTKAG